MLKFNFCLFIEQVNLSTVKRCVLFSYNPITKLIDMRHFSVTVSPVGLNRNVKKVVIGKVPNLARCEDIADFVEMYVISNICFECQANVLY